ncbi:helix-turn-helix transcriptional regulator [Parapedobacter soli]|uniref:helix-turn-helix transcriptional regulator n=1 Tax=Parapedobacter soli TaxID=416955 RepID=UPI0021C59EAF|nr:AraC family transcriptional regulator [Parapedobacter soli]
MYPTLTFSYSNPMRKDVAFFADPPDGLVAPLLPAVGYRNRTTCFIHESQPSFGLSFGFLQLTCNRPTWGRWRASHDCIVIGYSRAGNLQMAIRGYGDAIGPHPQDLAGCPVPGGLHRLFANAGVHQCYYVACSHGLLDTLVEDSPALAKLKNIPDDWKIHPWQYYRAAEEDFRILEGIRTCDRQGMGRHRFVQQQFVRLMRRYAERIEQYGDDPGKQAETQFHRAADYIDKNFRNPNLSYTLIADAVNLSVDGLKKVFQRRSFKAIPYINLRRLDEAARLLRTTDTPIRDIAYGVGFADASHFSTLFREKFSRTPSEYRKALKNK